MTTKRTTTKRTGARLPRALKKKLEASLENLSAKEAGRLWLIYTHEAAKKGDFPPANAYPPIKELIAALQRRLDKSRGKSGEAEAVNRLNGFVLLQHLFLAIGEEVNTDSLAAQADLLSSGAMISTALRDDAISDLSRDIRMVAGHFPKPVSHDDMMGLTVVFEGEEEPIPVDDIRNWLHDFVFPDEWERRFRYLGVPQEWLDALEPEKRNRHDPSEEHRRRWLGEQSPEYIAATFPSDAHRERWLRQGGFVFQDEYDAEVDKVAAMVPAWIQAGDLKATDAAIFEPTLMATDYPVPIVDGKIPAWVALKALWGWWLDSRECYVDRPKPVEWAPDGAYSIIKPRTLKVVPRHDVYNLDGTEPAEFEHEELVALATEYLNVCRQRPWGKGIRKEIDDTELVRVLTQVANPFLHLYMYEEPPAHYRGLRSPDWGLVDWATFDQSEKPPADVHPHSWDVEPVVTVGNLERNLEREGLPKWRDANPSSFGVYYPVESAAYHRQMLRRLIEKTLILELHRRTFTYGTGLREGRSLRISDHLGIEMATQLEKAIDRFRDTIVFHETVKRAVETISERYFGGLPVLVSHIVERIEWIDDYIAAIRADLDRWLARLEAWPWGIDVSELRLGDQEPDTDIVERLVDKIVYRARFTSKITEEEDVIFGGKL